MFHKEGHKIIFITIIAISIALIISFSFIEYQTINYLIAGFCFVFLVLILQFFRNPKRALSIDDNAVIAPADGKVVVIEKVFEPEFLKTEYQQISIFMSPINVHVNRYPISGTVVYSQYHKGKYLVAWHPKSSTENERTTVVIEQQNQTKILYRQIAGALAKRIVNYAKVGAKASQGEDSGFIKFGSRVDVLVPLEYKITVELNEKVIGGITRIACKP